MFDHNNDLTINCIMSKVPDHSRLRDDPLSIHKSSLNNYFHNIDHQLLKSPSLRSEFELENDPDYSNRNMFTKIRLLGIDKSNPREVLFHELSTLHTINQDICDCCGSSLSVLTRGEVNSLCEICSDRMMNEVSGVVNGSSTRLL